MRLSVCVQWLAKRSPALAQHVFLFCREPFSPLVGPFALLAPVEQHPRCAEGRVRAPDDDYLAPWPIAPPEPPLHLGDPGLGEGLRDPNCAVAVDFWDGAGARHPPCGKEDLLGDDPRRRDGVAGDLPPTTLPTITCAAKST